MPKPLAKEDDKMRATTRGNPFPVWGKLDAHLSPNVIVEHKRAAVAGSQATSCGTVVAGSKSVLINGRPAARDGDTARTGTGDPFGRSGGCVIAAGTVLAGD